MHMLPSGISGGLMSVGQIFLVLGIILLMLSAIIAFFFGMLCGSNKVKVTLIGLIFLVIFGLAFWVGYIGQAKSMFY